MRSFKLLLCLFLFLSPANAGQLPLLGGGSPNFVATDSDAIALFAAMPVQPNGSRRALIQNTIVCLKTNSVWASIDGLQVYAAHEALSALVDWKVPSRVAILVNGPTFTVDRGYTTDGISQYLDTNYNPTTNAVSFAQDSAFIAYWSTTNNTFSSSAFGWFDGTDGVTLLTRNASNQITYRINQATGVNTAGLISDASGMTLINRSGAAAIQIDKNGVNIATNTTASAAINSATFNTGRATASGFVAAEHSIVAWGGSLTSSPRAAMYSCMLPYMQAIGASP